MLKQSKELNDFLREYAKNPKGFVVLSGENGTGKTYAAKAVYGAVTPHRPPIFDKDIAIFVTEYDLFYRFCRDFSKAEQILDEMTHCKFLVLDDLGTHDTSPGFLFLLYAIVDRRWQERNIKGTLITTNLNQEKMRLKFGDAFMSRAALSGRCFRCTGYDRRLNDYYSHFEASPSLQNDLPKATHQ